MSNGGLHVALVGPYAGAHAPRGGVETSVTRLALALVEAGVRVTVIAPTREEAVAQPGIDVLWMQPRSSRLLPAARFSYPRAFRPWRRAVCDALREIRPDVVHGHGLLAHGLAVTDWRECPRVVTAHGNPWHDVSQYLAGPRGRLMAAFASALADTTTRRADIIVGASADPRANLSRTTRRFTHIPNIVDETFFAAGSRPLSGRVVYCGGSRTIKGWDVLAASWERVSRSVPSAELVAIGVSRRAVAGVPAARVLPNLTSRELAQEMARASVLVVPSRYEVAPAIIAEAWAVGLPVIATAVGGVIAMAERAAVLVAPDDPVALGGAIVEHLHDSGSDAVDQRRREGRQRAEGHRAKSVAQRHKTLYEQLLRWSRSARTTAAAGRHNTSTATVR